MLTKNNIYAQKMDSGRNMNLKFLVYTTHCDLKEVEVAQVDPSFTCTASGFFIPNEAFSCSQPEM